MENDIFILLLGKFNAFDTHRSTENITPGLKRDI